MLGSKLLHIKSVCQKNDIFDTHLISMSYLVISSLGPHELCAP